MAAVEQSPPTTAGDHTPPVQIPTDEQIEAITNPGDLPDFLNRGLLRSVVTAIEDRQRRVAGIDHKAVLVGRRGYLSRPERYKGLLAAILPGRRPDTRVLAIDSNLGPGLFLRLTSGGQGEFLDYCATLATHTGAERSYYSKSSSSPMLGHPATVGHVIRTALPVILEAPVNKG